MKALLTRYKSDDNGTFGSLSIPNVAFACETLELPWRDNERDFSCIPPGIYSARVTYSNKFGTDLYELLDVPGRFKVRIHAGNRAGDVTKGLASDVQGCILVGMRLGELKGQPAVLSSRVALSELMLATRNADIELEITEIPGLREAVL